MFLGYHDIKVGRTIDELHRGVVHKQVLKLYVCILLVMHAMNYLAPHAGGLEHVALIDARHLTATLCVQPQRPGEQCARPRTRDTP